MFAARLKCLFVCFCVEANEAENALLCQWGASLGGISLHLWHRCGTAGPEKFTQRIQRCRTNFLTFCVFCCLLSHTFACYAISKLYKIGESNIAPRSAAPVPQSQTIMLLIAKPVAQSMAIKPIVCTIRDNIICSLLAFISSTRLILKPVF